MERIEEQIQQLRQEIEAHNYAYYVLSSPTISDYDFDQLLKQLERLEQEHPDLITRILPHSVSGETVRRALPKWHTATQCSLWLIPIATMR